MCFDGSLLGVWLLFINTEWVEKTPLSGLETDPARYVVIHGREMLGGAEFFCQAWLYAIHQAKIFDAG